MSPEIASRTAARLADALSVIADEGRRDDASQDILHAHYECAGLMVDAFIAADSDAAWDEWPDIGGHNGLAVTVVSLRGETHRAVDFAALAEAWRSWGARVADERRAA